MNRMLLDQFLRKAGLGAFATALAFFGTSVTSHAQVSVTSTGGTPSATYATVTQAVTAINSGTHTGTIDVAVVAGYTETVPVGGIALTATGDALNSITFHKSGSGTNPLLTAYAGGTGTSSAGIPDGIFRLMGSDYVTIDGIDLLDPTTNTTNATRMEYGYGFFRPSATDGCQYNTIKNCTITLSRENNNAQTAPIFNGSVGIASYQVNISAPFTVITPTAATGSASNNKIYSNTIQNCNIGVGFHGYFPATYTGSNTLLDVNNDIGGSSAATGNTIKNFGGATSATNVSNGIQMQGQFLFNVSYNTINNNDGGGVNHVSTLRGIFISGNTQGSSGTVQYNTITVKNGNTTSQVSAIENNCGTNTSTTTTTLDISYNTIANCTNNSTAGGTTYLIYNSAGNPTTLNINGNSISNFTTTAISGTFGAIYALGNPTNLSVNDNNILGVTFTGATNSSTIYLFRGQGGTATTGTGTMNNNHETGITLSSSTTVATTSTIYYNYVSGSFANLQVRLNSIDNVSYPYYSGTAYLFYNGATISNSGLVQGNGIVGGWSRGSLGSGTTYCMYFAGASLSSATWNIAQNSFIGISQPSSTGVIAGMYNFDGASPYPVKNFFNNTFGNWTNGTGTVYCHYGYAYGGTGTAKSTIHDNSWNNIVCNGSTYGIYLPSTSINNLDIYKNTVTNITNNTGTTSLIYGMYLSGTTGTNLNVYQNKVAGLTGTAFTTGSINGVYNPSAITNLNFYNNYIGDFSTPVANVYSTTNPNFCGLYIGSGTNVKVAYNTIRLNMTSTGVNFGPVAFFFSTTPTSMTVNNNILINTSTANGTGKAVVLQRNGTALTNYNTNSNNNLFYAGTPSATKLIYYDATNSDQTLAAFQARVTPRESYSVTESSTFLSTNIADPNYLHLDPAVATQCESGGVNVPSITTVDYEDQIRAGNGGYGGTGSAPDIGADENEFALQDNLPPVIIPPTPSNSCSNGNLSFGNVNITDQTGIPLSGALIPRIYYKKAFNGTWYSTPGQYVSGGAKNSLWNFTINVADFGGWFIGDSIRYFFIAQDVALQVHVGSVPAGAVATDVNTVTTYPANANLFQSVLLPSLNGTYGVGVGQNYTTLTAAAAAYNNACLVGNVTFLLTDATYNTAGGEVFPITFNQAVGSGPSTTLTIKPTSGVTATVTGASTTALIKLNGADYVTIDGSNNGSTSRNLTLANTGTTASSSGVLISSLGTGAGATVNTIKNCNISTGIVTSATYGISVGGATAGVTGADNDITTIQNNAITGASVGVYAYATGSTNPGANDNMTIVGNTVTYNGLTGTVIPIGIQCGNGLNGIVSQNTVDVQTGGSGQPTGIQIETGFLFSTITRNSVLRSLTTSTGGYAGRGITVGTGSANSGVLLANNFVAGVNGTGWSTFGNSSQIGIGIGVVSSVITSTEGGTKVYYNSVNLYGDYSAGGYPTTCLTAALYIGTGASNLDVRNNILVNTLNNPNVSGTTSKNYAIYSSGTSAAFTTINNNDYYVAGTQGKLASIGAVDRLTLADIQTGFGQNVNSINVAPTFTSNTDLHLPVVGGNAAFDDAGSNCSVTTDYDNDTRAVTSGLPTIGADEIGFVVFPPTITGAVAQPGACSAADIVLNGVTITNAQGIPITGAYIPRLWYRKNSGAWSSNAGTFVSGTTTNSVWNFGVTVAQLGGMGTGDIAYYYIVAQTNTTPTAVGSAPFGAVAADVLTITTPPASPFTTQVYPTLNGIYSVGAGGNFATLTAAAAAYNNYCITGPVIFELTNPVGTPYSSSNGETFPISFNANSYASPTKTLIVRPASDNQAAIVGNVATAVIKINGGDYITIDGSNSGFTDRSLSITNLSTASSAVVWVSSLGAGAGSTNVTVKNLNLTSGSGAVLQYGITLSGTAVGSGSQGADNDNVTLQNNNIGTASIGIAAYGTAATNPGAMDNFQAIGNIITHNGTIGATEGIQVGNGLNGLLSQNTVDIQTTTSPGPVGISIEGNMLNCRVTRNKVLRCLTTTTGGYAGRGITVGTGSATSGVVVDNNFVAGVNGSNWSTFSISSTMGIGIGVVGQSSTMTTVEGGTKVYYNSVNLYGPYSASNTGTTNTAALWVGSGASNLDIRNNIFKNTLFMTGATAAKQYSVWSDAAASAFATMNNNAYYVNTANQGVLGYIGGDKTTLAAMQSGFGGNTLSLFPSVAPAFTSNTDLHLPVVADNAPYDDAAVAISGYSTDIDNDDRDASLPTIGGDEIGLAVFPPVITATQQASSCGAVDIALTNVHITNGVGAVITGAYKPRVYYKKNAGAWSSNAGTIVSGNANDSYWNFLVTVADLGGLAQGDVVTYYVVAQVDFTPTAVGSSPSGGIVASDVLTVTTPPTTPFSTTVLPTLSGSYNVGVGGTYTTLTAAANAYNTSCIGGPITFNLVNATYSAGETFPITFNAVSGSSATNTLTIKPASDVQTTITGSHATAILVFNGADYITVDGSNSGSTDRSLTIVNTNTTSGVAAVQMASLGTAAGATNIKVKNVNINMTAAYSTAISYGFSIGLATSGSPGADNDNVTIQNNFIKGASVGVYCSGTAGGGTAGSSDNLKVTDNIIQDSTGSASTVYGIICGGGNNGELSKNWINVWSAGSALCPVGIDVDAGFYNALVTRNRIDRVTTLTTGGWGGRGITVGTGNATSGVVVSNNFISGVNGSNYSFWYDASALGIALGVQGNATGGGTVVEGGTKVIYNSINMYGNYEVGGYPTACLTAGLFVHSSCSALDIRNNIIVNSMFNQNASGGSSKNYSVYCLAANTAFTTMNNNDYSVSGSQGVLSYMNAVDQTTLATLQTAFGQNTASVSVVPSFTSNTNLHLPTTTPASIADGAASGTGITIDYDGTTRLTLPTIGGHEVIPTCDYLSVTDVTTVGTCANTSNGSITVAATCSSCQGNMEYSIDGGATWATSSTFNNLSSGSGYNVKVRDDGNTTCIANWASNPVTVPSIALPTVNITSSSAPMCVGDTRTLTATPAGGTFTATGPGTISGGVLTATGSGLISVSYAYTDNGTGCSNTAIQAITVNSLPTPAITSSGADMCIGETRTLTGTPSGGNWAVVSGPGSISGNVLTATASGSVVISYTAFSGSCSASVNQTITVTAGPNPQFSSSNAPMCVGESRTITFTPAGGTLTVTSGPGSLSGNVLTAIGAGTIELSLTATSGSCSVTVTQSIVANALPTVSNTTSNANLCVGQTRALTGTPAGGTWSVTGPGSISGSTLTATGAGNIIVTYSFTDGGTGCSNTAGVTIVGLAAPTVTNTTSTANLCVNGTRSLTGTPAGGTWSVTGPGTISGSTLTATGAGAIVVTYTFSNGTCSASAAATITGVALPTPSITSSGSAMCVGSTRTLTGTPAGGTFSVSGPGSLSGSTLTATGAGSISVTYNYTDGGTGCSNAATQSITANALPTVSVTSSGAAMCVGSTRSLTGSPAGGTFTVTGPGMVSGSTLTATGAGTINVTYSYTDSGTGCSNTGTQAIVSNALPTVSVTSSGSPICVGSTRTLTATPAGGTFTVSGPGSLSGNTLTATGAGSISVTYNYTDGGTGCSNAATQAITSNALPTPSITSSSDPMCVGSTRTLVGSPTGGTWSVSGPGTVSGSTLTATGAGAISVTYNYTDGATGCSNTATQSITGNALPTVSNTTSTANLCVGQTRTVSGTPAGGTFTVTGPGTLSGTTLTCTGAGTIVVTYSFTDSGTGCSNTAAASVPAFALPTPSITSSGATMAVGESRTLTGSPVGGTFSVSGPGTLSGNTLTANAAGTIVVTYSYTNAGGCSASVTQNITVAATSCPYAFEVTIAIAPANCGSGKADLTIINVAGGTAPYTYSKNGGSTFQTSNTFTAVTAGIYTLVVKDASGCTYSQSQQINGALALGAPVATNACNGNPASATANPTGGYTPYTYAWSNGQTGQVMSTTTSGTYTVTVTDSKGCTKFNKAIVKASPVMNLAYTLTNVTCPGASTGKLKVTVTSGSGGLLTTPLTYLWSNGATAQSLLNLPAGVYTVTVTDAIGCTKTGSATLTQPAVMAINSITWVPVGTKFTVTMSVSGGSGTRAYRRLTADGLTQLQTSTTGTFTLVPAGTYVFEVKDTKCLTVLTQSETISLNNLDDRSGVSQTAVNFTLVPNPTRSSVNLVFDNGATPIDGTLELHDVTGRLLRTMPIGSVQNGRVDLSGIAPGVLLVTYRSENGKPISKRLVVVQ